MFGLNNMKYLLLSLASFALVSFAVAQTQTVGVFTNSENSFDGYTLYAPIPGFDSFLINNCGEVVNQWTSEYRIGLSAYLLEDGSLLRTGQLSSGAIPAFSGGGTGGRVERFNWEGELVWHIDWADDTKHHHHDIEMMPNGNILLISWESHSYEEAVSLGKNTNNTQNPVWCCTIVEIEPTGSEGGNVVWFWSAWDHMVQDTDPNKPNYGVISENPRKFNINYTSGQGPNNGAGNSDWMHCNAVDYNAELDQIVISSAKFCEFWIIDHSLTTEEAATEAGDLLYRWGNPRTYNRGTAADQMLYHQHDSYWTEGGDIMVYNNGKNRPEGEYSTVEIITTPLSEDLTYPISETESFAPSSYSWRYPEDFDANFYSQNISGAQRLSNGNTLICEGAKGHIFEVTPEEEMVWSYISPITAFGPTVQGEELGNTSVFRAYRYGPDYQAFAGRDMTPGDIIELDSWDTGCSTVEVIAPSNFTYPSVYPNPSNSSFTVYTDHAGLASIYNIQGQLVECIKINSEQQVQVGEKLQAGYYLVIFKDSNSGLSTESRIVKI
mgnify:CR=1 FL=1